MQAGLPSHAQQVDPDSHNLECGEMAFECKLLLNMYQRMEAQLTWNWNEEIKLEIVNFYLLLVV